MSQNLRIREVGLTTLGARSSLPPPRRPEPRYQPPRPSLCVCLPQLGGIVLSLPGLSTGDISRGQRVREIALQPVDAGAGVGELGQCAVSQSQRGIGTLVSFIRKRLRTYRA